MKNITLAINEDLLKACRAYAKKHHLTLNALVRNLLAQTTAEAFEEQRLEEMLKLMDRAKAKPITGKIQREDIYDV